MLKRNFTTVQGSKRSQSPTLIAFSTFLASLVVFRKGDSLIGKATVWKVLWSREEVNFIGTIKMTINNTYINAFPLIKDEAKVHLNLEASSGNQKTVLHSGLNGFRCGGPTTLHE